MKMEDNQDMQCEEKRFFCPHLSNPKYVAHDAKLLCGHQKHVYSVFHMDLEFADARRRRNDACV